MRGQFHNHFRPNRPSIHRPFHRWRRILGIAFRSTAVYPLDEGIDFILLQRTIIREVAIILVREPRRHFPHRYRGLDRLCPGTRILVGDERHRRDLTGPVTALTIFLENRKHIFGESDRGLFAGLNRHCQS